MEKNVTIDIGTDAIVQLRGHYAIKNYKHRETYRHELKMLKHLQRHPNIIKYLRHNPDTHSISFIRYFGDLMTLLLKNTCPPLSNHLCTLYRAIQYCHTMFLVHRDIKPENILVKTNGDAVLCDFARSRYAPWTLPIKFDGTYMYGAPEALEGKCNLKNDIWSLGVVIFCMVEGQMPFEEDEKNKELNFDESYWRTDVHSRIRGILPHMLDSNFETRAAISICAEFEQY